MINEKEIFQRTELLMGSRYLDLAERKRVIIFGVGGVGSWCAEMLIRSGITHLTLVDSDKVAVTNINRQLMATVKTIGQVKVEVLKERLLEINPNAEIVSMQVVYSPETAGSFKLESYDFIIDAIDSLSNKVHLIRLASQMPGVFFSSMGAALKIDPSYIRVDEFWKVKGCPLAAALRTRIKKLGGLEKKFLCVYSNEARENKGEKSFLEESNAPVSQWDTKKARINGTMSYLPAIFGMTLASLVVKDIDIHSGGES
ncbi:tRNA threonylcarbamoyladenosine dehydratase [Petrimonas sulfuriphila]|uniref:tRNA threonylcarbamoyladenosine dehydratase n=1 Tax=Petrimonas TaxID=307628 RepID=UPI0030CFB0B5